MSIRKLKYHEKKLLKKVDFLWTSDDNVREGTILRRYHITNRNDYVKYNRLAGKIHSYILKLKLLSKDDLFRIKMTKNLLLKVYNMGLIHKQKSLSSCDKINASSFCRRRLPIVMVRLKMAENVSEAVQFIEEGHIRIGPNTITDTAFIVTRTLEDFITWAPTSKIKRTIAKYNDQLDDYVLLGN